MMGVKKAKTNIVTPNVHFTPASTPGLSPRLKGKKKPTLFKVNVPLHTPPAEINSTTRNSTWNSNCNTYKSYGH